MSYISVGEAMNEANRWIKDGDFVQARLVMEQVRSHFPENRQIEDAVKRLDSLIKMKPSEFTINELMSKYHQGRFDEVITGARKVLVDHPNDFFIWNIMGVSLAAKGNTIDAISAFKQVVKLKPNYADGFNNLGELLRNTGDFYKAKRAFEKAISLNPTYAVAHQNIGSIYHAEGKFEKAINSFENAVRLDANLSQAQFKLGVIYLSEDREEQAINALKAAISAQPKYKDACIMLARIYKTQAKFDEVVEVYENFLNEDPFDAMVYNSLGVAYIDACKPWKAIEAYHKAGSIDLKFAVPYNNIGNALKTLKKTEKALEAYEEAVSRAPDYELARVQKLHLEMHFCEWKNFDNEQLRICEYGVNKEMVPPWIMLSLEDNVYRQKLRAELYVKYGLNQNDIGSPKKFSSTQKFEAQSKRIRIGYFSADFHIFPGMFLMAGMLEEHDRENFEIIAFSYGPDENDSMRKRIVKAVDEFVDVHKNSVHQIVEIAREKNLDVAIHRNGHTRHAKTEIFAQRVAPVQINYLGYPGTIGGDFIDYIVADKVVLPEEHKSYYSEKVISLPHSYQPNDRKRTIVKTQTSRADFSLPEKAIVLCCFNNMFKITPLEFRIWMSVMKKIENSVLWLLKTNEKAENNLRKEASKLGVKPARIIFADKLPQEEHLARHKHADLFLDTFFYNAHTTASDALWAGLPVVTKRGNQFSARVAASLLTAVGLEELITETEEDYEDLIMKLAEQPRKLKELKNKLASNILKEPLFDTKRYTRNFEAGIKEAYRRASLGQKPDHIDVGEA